MSDTVDNAARVVWSHVPCRDVPVALEFSRFKGPDGVEELHLMARPTEPERFAKQLDWLRHACGAALDELGVDPGGTIFRRFFCSDLSNQVDALRACPFSDSSDGHDPRAVSWVCQPPARPAEVAVWSYVLADPLGEIDKRLADSTLTLARGPLQHHWTTGIDSPGRGSTLEQTHNAFTAYEALLSARGLALADNVIRTWLFVRDIEADYADLVRARRELFMQRGLTPQTHYIASTGIQGATVNPAARVALDAYALGGVRPGQIEYVRVPNQLSPTDIYGVTFERATAVSYRDRKHVLVSGTASIDGQGDLLHPGDLAGQVRRTLENIAVLLRKAGARPTDLCMLIAYLRDPADADAVRQGIRECFGDVPLMVVAGAVCRPGWLVEIEGQAIVTTTRPELPPF